VLFYCIIDIVQNLITLVKISSPVNIFGPYKEKIMAKSFPDLLASVRQMLVGLEANAEAVSARGATQDFTKNGQSLLDSVNTLEAEQETLKAALKSKTAALDITVAQLKTWNSEANTAVKLAFRDQPEKWVEFGIKAKK
jgi:hypothetical protein